MLQQVNGNRAQDNDQTQQTRTQQEQEVTRDSVKEALELGEKLGRISLKIEQLDKAYQGLPADSEVRTTWEKVKAEHLEVIEQLKEQVGTADYNAETAGKTLAGIQNSLSLTELGVRNANNQGISGAVLAIDPRDASGLAALQTLLNLSRNPDELGTMVANMKQMQERIQREMFGNSSSEDIANAWRQQLGLKPGEPLIGSDLQRQMIEQMQNANPRNQGTPEQENRPLTERQQFQKWFAEQRESSPMREGETYGAYMERKRVEWRQMRPQESNPADNPADNPAQQHQGESQAPKDNRPLTRGQQFSAWLEGQKVSDPRGNGETYNDYRNRKKKEFGDAQLTEQVIAASGLNLSDRDFQTAWQELKKQETPFNKNRHGTEGRYTQLLLNSSNRALGWYKATQAQAQQDNNQSTDSDKK